MALLTIPSITKGAAASVSLNKAELFSLAAVAADSYFSVEANVKRCVVSFDSDPGSQKKVLSFDLSQANPTAPMLISLKGRDSFLIDMLVLEDYDGGVFVMQRSQLPSGFDISLGGGSGGGGGTVPQFLAGTAYPNIVLSYNGETYSKNVDTEGTFTLTEGTGALLSSLPDETAIRYNRYRAPLDGLVPGEFLPCDAQNTPDGSGIVTTTLGEWRNFLTFPVSQLNPRIGSAFYSGGVIQANFELV